MSDTDALPTLLFETQHDWETWLDEHHAATSGLWLKFAKKGSGKHSISYAAALESALCYGWIDGQKAAFDDQHWLQKFTPRRPKSIWSKVNREKAEALIATGRMMAAGLRQVNLAQADGRWEAAYDAQSTIQIPPDFQSQLDQHAEAREFFASLNSANRYAILFRIHTAKKPETRAVRIQKLIEMLLQRQTFHP
jgi:uncharacterized protein YdeI (YjbR/CyaY-like superfamily)